MEEKKVGIDLDGVLRNFTKRTNQLYNRYVEILDDVIGTDFGKISEAYEGKIYSFSKDPGYNTLVVEAVWKSEQTSLFLDAPEYPGSEGFVMFLKDLERSGNEVSIITHQYTHEAKLATLKWLSNHNVPFSCIFSDGDDKWKYCDILLDDKISNLEACIENGKKAFCMARPWNSELKGIPRGGYSDFISYILKEEWKQ